MTSTLVRPPTSDAEWALRVEQRLSRPSDTSRVGNWVLADVDGVLQAVAPDKNPIVFGEIPDTSDQIDAAINTALKGYLTETDAAKILTKATTGTSVGTLSPFDQIIQWAESIPALVNGFLNASWIPGFDASKIISGVLSQAITGWQAALALVGVPTPDEFVRLLRGLTPAAVTDQITGALHATSIDGFINNLNGTWSFINNQAENAVSNLIQQADGTIISQAQAIEHIANAVAAAGSTNMAAAAVTGQQVIDHGIAAIEGVVAQAGHTVEHYAQSLTNAFTAWTNSWTGQNLTAASAPDVSAAALLAAQLQAAQAAQTAAIAAQLPHFYGGSGTAGTSLSVTFSSTSVLPAGWTAVTPSFATKGAVNNTPCLTDSQAVGAVWSATDYLPKYLVLRGNIGLTTCVYAKVQNNTPLTGAAKCKIAIVVAGVETVLDTFTLPGSGTFVANQSYLFEATDYSFALTGPNGLSRTVNDVSHISQKGALYVYGGFATDGTPQAQQSVSTGNFTVPAGFTTGDKFDIMAVGSGGGAAGENASNPYSQYGQPGSGSGVTLTYGVNIPLSTTTFACSASFTGGGGGTGGPGTATNGTAGPDSTVVISGYGTVRGTGGAGGVVTGGGYPQLPSIPTSLVLNNNLYPYGVYTPWFSGSYLPGMGLGGPGGSYYANGSGGGSGEVLITPIQMLVPGTLLNWVFYDSGPSAGPAASRYDPNETTTSTTYTDLPTVDQVTVNIGPSGLAMVFINCRLGTTATSAWARMAFGITGATTRAADDGQSIGAVTVSGYGGGTVQTGSAFLVGSLNQGATNFRAKYRTDAGATANFLQRNIAVIPL